MKKAFTIMELLIAVGLLAAVLAAAGMVFNYSINAQRTAASTAETMHTLRAITDQINIDIAHNGNNSIVSPQMGGYLVLRSDDSNSAVYFFSTGDFQSWYDPNVRSNTARIYLGLAGDDPNNLVRDMLLLTPGYPSVLDYRDVSFAQCQANIANLEDPYAVLSTNRPDANSTNVRSLFAQHVSSFKIEWTYGWFRSSDPNRIIWWGFDDVFSDENNLLKPGGISVLPAEMQTITLAIQETKNAGPPPYYTVYWDPTNQQYWPQALKFTFTLYDSRGLFKHGRKFEHIVYIGK